MREAQQQPAQIKQCHVAKKWPACVKYNTFSQHGEDVRLLLPLLCMLGGRRGTFVEMGAFTGIDLSNTYMLEKCFNFTGVLIEGNPANFAKLTRSGRTATMVHSAVCSIHDPPTVKFSAVGGDFAGEPVQRHVSITKKHGKHDFDFHKQQATVEVPCRPLEAILRSAGFPSIDVLFLDVEGAEAKVLSTADLSMFRFVLVEAVKPKLAGQVDRHKAEVEPMLLRAGFRRERRLEASDWNPVYVNTAVYVVDERCINTAVGRHGDPGAAGWATMRGAGVNMTVKKKSDVEVYGRVKRSPCSSTELEKERGE